MIRLNSALRKRSAHREASKMFSTRFPTRHRTFLCAFLLLAIAVALPSALAQSTPAKFRIGYMDMAPKIDGTHSLVNWPSHEWALAAQLSGFTIVEFDDPSPSTPSVRVGYDDERLYLGFSAAHPDGVELRGSAASGDIAELINDPSFEVVLGSGSDPEKLFHYVLTIDDRLASASTEGAAAATSFPTKAFHATSSTSEEWLAELAIPWSELDITAPEDDDVLRINFKHNPGTPDQPSSTWQGLASDDAPEAFLKVQSMPTATFGRGKAIAGLTYDDSDNEGELQVALRGATTASDEQVVQFYMNDGKRAHGWKILPGEQSRRFLQSPMPQQGDGFYLKLQVVDEVGDEPFYEHTARFRQ